MSDPYDFVYACAEGHLEQVLAFIEEGGAIDEEDFLGRTGLSRACGAGQRAVVALLLDRGADVDHCESSRSISSSGRPPIAAAAEEGHLEIVALLLARGARPDTPTAFGQVALALAASHGHVDIVRALVRGGADIDLRQGFSDRSALGEAASGKQGAAILALLELGADPEVSGSDGRGALHEYCGSVWGACDPTVVRRLIEAGAAVDRPGGDGQTPLYLAARWNGPDPVGVLLAEGADVRARDRSGRTPLHAACEAHEADEVVPLLLEAGAEVDAADEEGRRPLHLACGNEHLSARVLAMLVAAGADVDGRDPDGSRPLDRVYALLWRDDADLSGKARVLLDAGASFDGILERAARNGDADIVLRLLDLGAEPLETDDRGRTALHWAAFDGKTEVVEVLLAAGIDPSTQDLNGDTALHHACREQHVGTAVALIRGGAPMAANARDRAPLYYAHPETRAALIEVLPALASVLGDHLEEVREGLRCASRGEPPGSCEDCGWTPDEEPRIGCPWCGKRGVGISDYEVLQGNPEVPTPNTEVRFGYTCAHCGLEFHNNWNALNTSSPWIIETGTSAVWRSEDGGVSWRRSWGHDE